MQVKCQHGFFKFFEQRVGEIAKFSSLTEFELVPENDYFTFDFISDAPKYALIGGEYLGAQVTKTFEGEPWEIFEENKLVFDFSQDLVLPILSVVKSVELFASDNYYISNGLILPGSVTDDGQRVTDYSAYFYFDSMKFKYTEVQFEST